MFFGQVRIYNLMNILCEKTPKGVNAMKKLSDVMADMLIKYGKDTSGRCFGIYHDIKVPEKLTQLKNTKTK